MQFSSKAHNAITILYLTTSCSISWHRCNVIVMLVERACFHQFRLLLFIVQSYVNLSRFRGRMAMNAEEYVILRRPIITDGNHSCHRRSGFHWQYIRSNCT